MHHMLSLLVYFMSEFEARRKLLSPPNDRGARQSTCARRFSLLMQNTMAETIASTMALKS